MRQTGLGGVRKAADDVLYRGEGDHHDLDDDIVYAPPR